MTNRMLSGSAALTLVFVLAACGSGSASPSAAASTPPPSGVAPSATPGPLDDLYQAAKAEGSVVLAWATPVEELTGLIAAFEAQYPGITVKAVNVRTGDQVNETVAEEVAGHVSLDVLDLYPYQMFPLIDRNDVVSTDWASLGVPADSVSLNGTTLAVEDSVSVWLYNTNLVSANDAPKSWADLLDPKWKGKISFSARSTGPLLALLSQWQQDPQKVTSYLKQLKTQDPIVASGNEPLDHLTNGEALIASVPIVRAYPAYQQGAPIAVVPISPMAGLPIAVAVPKNSPHPNAAKLMAAWLASSPGQAEMLKLGRGALGTGAQSGQAKWMQDAGVDYVRTSSEPDMREIAGTYVDAIVAATNWQQ